MNSRFRYFQKLLLPVAVLLLVAAGASQSSHAAVAQSAAGPKIQSLVVSGWTGHTVHISFSLLVSQSTCTNDSTISCSDDTPCTADGGTGTCAKQALAQIEYGPSKSYGSVYPSNYATVDMTDPSAAHSFDISGLQVGTTYHFRMHVKAMNGAADSDLSADKTFTTRASDSSTLPSVTVQDITCADTSCIVTFSTAMKANVTLGWDTTTRVPSIDGFCKPAEGGYTNCSFERTGTYLNTSRTLAMTGLTAKKTYYVRLLGVDSTGGASMTGGGGEDMKIVTAASSRDRTFSTGGCLSSVDGKKYPIGSCMPEGGYCATDAVIDKRCNNSCGYSCGSGQTCNDSGECLVDPGLKKDNPYQCNKSDCYKNGLFKSPAAAGCWASWPQCTANTILKVQKDRSCNLWLTCGTSVRTSPANGQNAEDLCLSLSACNELGPKGNCVHYLPPGQCDNDPLRFCANDSDCEAGATCNISPEGAPTQSLQDLTFKTPDQVKEVANLSGSVVAGIDWSNTGGGKVLQGDLPWQLMRQLGGNIALQNADFESHVPDPSPWVAVPIGETPQDALSVALEDPSNSPNHVLKVSPIVQIQEEKTCIDTANPDNPNVGRTCNPDTEIDHLEGGKNVAGTYSCNKDAAGKTISSTGACPDFSVKAVSYSGAASVEFVTSADEYYYASARIRAASGTPMVRFELGHGDFTKFTADQKNDDGSMTTLSTYVDIQATDAWQNVSIGPLKGLAGGTRVAAVLLDDTNRGDFYLDDVQVKPVLQVNTNPYYISPSCRLYPRDDSPSCDYTDLNGVSYRGWKGYCLESDSVTGSCLSWWPVDIIRGESDMFGSGTTAGYQDRTPLYLCAEAAGENNRNDFDSTNTNKYTVGANTHYYEPISSDACKPAVEGNNYTIGTCTRNDTITGIYTDWIIRHDASGVDKNIYENQISRVQFIGTGAGEDATGVAEMPNITFNNSPAFQSSSWAKPYEQGTEDTNRWINSGATHSKYYIFKNSTATADDLSYNGKGALVGDTKTMDPTKTYWTFVMSGCDKVKWPADTISGVIKNCVYASLVFDKASGKFLGYELGENDDTDPQDGSTELQPQAVRYQVVFTLKEMCNTIVQVVTPSGDNSAFAQRVNSRTYSVPELGFKKLSDATPFSGIAAPTPDTDPAKWPLLTVQSKNNEFPTGQVRSGAAYACNGDCSKAICHVNDPLDQSIVGAVCNMSQYGQLCGAVDSDTDGKADAICSGGVQAASSKGPQLFNGNTCNTKTRICDGTGECTAAQTLTCSTTKDTAGVGTTIAKATADATLGCIENPMSLFGHCSTNPNYTCTTSGDCEVYGAGTCESLCSDQIFPKCTVNSDCQAYGGGTCTAGRCTKKSVVACATTAECRGLGAGTCDDSGLGGLIGNASMSIACDGRCYVPPAQKPAPVDGGNVVRYSKFQASGNGEWCTKQAFGDCQEVDPATCSISGVSCTPGGWSCLKAGGGACVVKMPYVCSKSGASCDPKSAFSCGGNFGITSTGPCIAKATYACTNPSGKTCTAAATGSPECPYDVAVPTADLSKCGTSGYNCSCHVVGQCVVNAAKATYTSTGVEPKACASNQDCSYSSSSAADNVRFYAQEKIKRLFAQSYGIWHWDATSQSYVEARNSNPNNPVDGIAFNGWTPPTEICPMKLSYAAGSCTKETGHVCEASVSIRTSTLNDETAARNDGLAKCRASIACNGQDVTNCSTYKDTGTVVNYTSFDTASCLKNAADKWTCTGTCRIDASKTFMKILYTPSDAAPKETMVRPNNPPDDYCAIPPHFGNATFSSTNSPSLTIQGGNGSAGIKFNSFGDPEQSPLKSITIDWGDGAPETFSYPYAPRTDIKKPHILSHVYTYNKADTTHCITDGECVYPIHIMIEDSWGWCSTAIRQGSNPSGPDGTADDKGCLLPASQWPDTGLKVILQP